MNFILVNFFKKILFTFNLVNCRWGTVEGEEFKSIYIFPLQLVSS